jgi:hypothetical protein
MSKVNPYLMQVHRFKIWFLFVHTSRTSWTSKARYPQIQKLLYAVVLARRKLRHYFEAHLVTVVSSFPLGQIIRNPDEVGRIAKWSVELMGETLAYVPRKAIKSQILADFITEWTDTQLPPPQIQAEYHYVKTSNRSRNICNGPLTPVTSTHICIGCCLAPVTYKRARTTPGWPPQRPLPMWTSGNGLLKRPLHEFFVTDVK